MKRSDVSSPVSGKGVVGLGVKIGLIWPAKLDILGPNVAPSGAWERAKVALDRRGERPKDLKTP